MTANSIDLPAGDADDLKIMVSVALTWEVALMPVMLRIVFLIGLVIWPLPVSAQSTQQSSSFERWTGRWLTDDWISSWAAEHFGRHVDRPSADKERYAAEHFGSHELDRIKGSTSAETGWLRHTSNLEDENRRLAQELDATRTVLTILDEQATEVVRERGILAAKAGENSQRVIALERELSASLEKSYQFDRANELLTAEVDELRQSIAALESKLSASQEKNNQLNRANKLLTAEQETQQPRSGWIARLLGYHRGYIDAVSKVEISAGEERERKTLTKKLETALGRDFSVPDLAALGAVFVGGHVASISGAATGRIVYRHTDGNPLEFWLVARRGQSSNVNFGQNGELNIVHWQGNDSEYALISSVAWSELAPIAGKLHRLYSE